VFDQLAGTVLRLQRLKAAEEEFEISIRLAKKNVHTCERGIMAREETNQGIQWGQKKRLNFSSTYKRK
jgi:hypothetical protein